MLVDVSSEFMLYLVSDVRYRITHVGFGFARVRNMTIRLVIALRALMCKREFKDTPVYELLYLISAHYLCVLRSRSGRA